MKIGIDASRYGHDSATGVEMYSYNIINGIIKNASKDDEVILYSKTPLRIKGAKNRVIKKARLWTLLGLSSEIKKSPPDVLFVPSHVLPLKLPNRCVITIHDVAFKVLRNSYSFFQYHYLNWSTKFAVKNATNIIVPSLATKNDLIKHFGCFPDKIHVVHHGYDPVLKKNSSTPAFFNHLKISPSVKYIFFVGRLESKKNIPKLLEAFSNFSSTSGKYKLILAGKRGVGFDNILRTLQHLKLEDKVVMPGYITDLEKNWLYDHAEFVAFPSLYEGFGFPILEAFQHGRAVLTSDTSSMPEVGGDAVHYVDPYDINSIMYGIEKLANDDKYRKELVEKGKKKLKDFGWDKACKKTLDIIKTR